jgi:hypothetical protein
MSEDRAKLIIEVTAGVVPGKVMSEHTRRYALSSEQWAQAGKENGKQANLLAELNGRAQGYAGYLMLQPDYLNWVRTDWLWL